MADHADSSTTGHPHKTTGGTKSPTSTTAYTQKSLRGGRKLLSNQNSRHHNGSMYSNFQTINAVNQPKGKSKARPSTTKMN